MNDIMLWLPPTINVIVTGAFAGVVLRQYIQRRRPHQLYWSLAMLMAFIASFSYTMLLVVDPTSSTGILFFRLYYALGGAIMPSWLGLGSVALISKPHITRWCAIILSIASIIAATLVFTTDIHLDRLSQIAGTPGTGTLQTGPFLLAMIISLNTLGVVMIAGIALWSGWKMLRRQNNISGLRAANILWANTLIFTGAILNALAGSLARFLGHEDWFWLIMAMGWIVLFAGVILASQRSKAAKAVPAIHTVVAQNESKA